LSFVCVAPNGPFLDSAGNQLTVVPWTITEEVTPAEGDTMNGTTI